MHEKMLKYQVMAEYLCFHFIKEKLLLEVMQSILRTVVVKVKWIQNVPDNN
jgi:hypothetical protein